MTNEEYIANLLRDKNTKMPWALQKKNNEIKKLREEVEKLKELNSVVAIYTALKESEDVGVGVWA